MSYRRCLPCRVNIPSYKDILDLLKKGLTLEAQEKIMELREGALELQEENFGLRESVRQLEEQLRQSKNLRFENEMYWLADAGKKEGPFCVVCHDRDGKLVRLLNGKDYEREWRCPVCAHLCGQDL